MPSAAELAKQMLAERAAKAAPVAPTPAPAPAAPVEMKPVPAARRAMEPVAAEAPKPKPKAITKKPAKPKDETPPVPTASTPTPKRPTSGFGDLKALDERNAADAQDRKSEKSALETLGTAANALLISANPFEDFVPGTPEAEMALDAAVEARQMGRGLKDIAKATGVTAKTAAETSARTPLEAQVWTSPGEGRHATGGAATLSAVKAEHSADVVAEMEAEAQRKAEQKAYAEGKSTTNLRPSRVDRRFQESEEKWAERQAKERLEALKEKRRDEFPDIDAMLTLAEDIGTARKESGSKAVTSYLKERTGQILANAVDENDPPSDEVYVDLHHRAAQQAARELSALWTDGAWAWPPTEAAMEQARKEHFEEAPTAGDFLRALLPQRTLTPSGKAARTESLGMWGMQMLSVPEFLVSAALESGVSGKPFSEEALSSIANRRDLVTYRIDNDPEMLSDLTSGNDWRVSKAVASLSPWVAASIAIPDTFMPLGWMGKVAKREADAAKASYLAEKLRGSPEAARRAQQAMDDLPPGASDDLRAEAAEKALRQYAEETVAKGKTREGRAIEQGVKPRLDKVVGAYEGDVEAALGAVDTKSAEDPLARIVRDDMRAAFGADPDVAAYMDQADQSGAENVPRNTVNPNLWPDAAPVPDRAALEAEAAELRTQRAMLVEEIKAGAEGRPMEEGEIATDPRIRKFDADLAANKKRLDAVDTFEAAQRGMEKARGQYDQVGRDVLERLQEQAYDGAAPAARVSTADAVEPPPPPRPDTVSDADVAALFGTREVPSSRIASLLEARSADELLKKLGYFPPDARNAVAQRLLVTAGIAHDGANAYDTLKATLRADPEAWRRTAAEIRKRAAEKVRALRATRAAKEQEVAALQDALDAQKYAPEHKARIDAARKALAEAEKAARDAERAAERAGEADVGKHAERVKKARARLEDLRTRGVPEVESVGAAPPSPTPPATPAADPGKLPTLEQIADPLKKWQMERQFGAVEWQTPALSHEPYSLPGANAPRAFAPLDAQAAPKAWQLYRHREAYNLSQNAWPGDGAFPEAWAGGVHAVYEHVLPEMVPIETRPTVGSLRKADGTAKDTLKGFEAGVERFRAAHPDLPEAVEWAPFYHSWLAESDTWLVGPRAKYRLPKETIRLDDIVFIKPDPNTSDLVKQPGRVIGFRAAPDGTPRVVVEILEPVRGEAPRFQKPKDAPVAAVEVPPESLQYQERGRFFVDNVHGGAKVPHKGFTRYRHPTETARVPRKGGAIEAERSWQDIYAAEKADTSGFAQKLRYGPDSDFRQLNPPKVGTPDRFVPPPEFKPVKDGMERGLPRPSHEPLEDVVDAPEAPAAPATPPAPKRKPATPEQIAAAEKALAEVEALDAAHAKQTLDAYATTRAQADAARDALRKAEAAYRAVLASTPKPARPLDAAKLVEKEQALERARAAVIEADEAAARHLRVSGEEADKLLARALEHPDQVRALDAAMETLQRENATLLAGLRAQEEWDVKNLARAKARPDAKRLPVIPEDTLRTSEELANRYLFWEKTSPRMQRGVAAAILRNTWERIVAVVNPKYEAMREALKPAAKRVLDDFGGAVNMLNEKLAHAVTVMDPKSAEILDAAISVAEQHAAGFRAARRSRMAPEVYVLAARAYLSPALAVTVEELRSLTDLLDAFVQDETMRVEDLRELLRERSRAIADAHRLNMPPAQSLQPPQRGDILLARAMGMADYHQLVLLHDVGFGAAYAPEHVKALEEHVLGTRRSALGQQILFRMMSDPYRYTPDLRGVFGDRFVPKRVAEPFERVPTLRAKKGEKVAAEGVEAATTEQLLGTIDLSRLANLGDTVTMDQILEQMTKLDEAMDGDVYLPRALRDAVVEDIEAALATYNKSKVVEVGIAGNLWKQMATIGLLNPRPRHTFNNRVGDLLAIVPEAGWKAALSTALATVLDDAIVTGTIIPPVGPLKHLPRIPTATMLRLVDYLRGVPSGKTTRDVLRWVDVRLQAINLTYGNLVSDILEGDANTTIRIPGLPDKPAAWWAQEALKYKIPDTFVSGELTRNLEQTEAARAWRDAVNTPARKIRERFDNRATRAVEAGGEAVLGSLGALSAHTRDVVNVLNTRRKTALWAYLIHHGKSVEEAARIVNEAVPAYSGALWSWERALSYFIPWLSFEKLNTRRGFRALATHGLWSPRIYRLKQAQRGLQHGSTILSYYFDNNDEYGYDTNSMREEGDPLVVERVLAELVKQGMTEDEARAEIDRRVLAGVIPRAIDRYEAGLARLRAASVDDAEIRRLAAANEIPEWEGLGVYFAPDPTMRSLPEHLWGQYVVTRTRSRSQAAARWNSRLLDERGSYDEVDMVAAISDSNLQFATRLASAGGLAATVATSLALAIHPDEEIPVGTKDQLLRGLRDATAMDAMSSPAVRQLLTAAEVSHESGKDVRLPSTVTGPMLARMGVAVKKTVPVPGETGDSPDYKTAYYLPAATADALLLMNSAGFFGLVELESSLFGKGHVAPPGDHDTVDPLVESYTGVRPQVVSPTREGASLDYAMQQRAEAYAKETTKGESTAALPGDAAVRNANLREALLEMKRDPARRAEAAGAPSRILSVRYREGERPTPEDVEDVRALLVLAGEKTPEEALSLTPLSLTEPALLRRLDGKIQASVAAQSSTR